MEPTDKKLIAVFGATGQQGGGVVRARALDIAPNAFFYENLELE